MTGNSLGSRNPYSTPGKPCGTQSAHEDSSLRRVC